MTRPRASDSASNISITPLPQASSPLYTRLSAALATAQYEAFTNPPSNIFTLFCPLSRTPGVSKAEALQELTARHEAWRQWDTGVWVMATKKKETKTLGREGEEKEGGVGEEEEEEVVGGACWYFNTDDNTNAKVSDDVNGTSTGDSDALRAQAASLEKPEEEVGGDKDDEAGFACWWPAGPGREIADKLLEKLMTSRSEVVKGPHALCEILFTIPSHRNQDVGQRLVEWGIEEAQKRGLKDVWVEGYKGGEGFFEQIGFEKRGEVKLEVDETGTVMGFSEGEEREEARRWKGELDWEGVRMWKSVA